MALASPGVYSLPPGVYSLPPGVDPFAVNKYYYNISLGKNSKLMKCKKK
jgi:hypothetical protein